MAVLVFKLDRQLYCLRVEDVREVVPIARLTALAGAPPYLRGLLTLRGRYIPILDGRSLVGAAPQFDLESHIVIVGGEEAEFGLLVDQVEHVLAADGGTALGKESAAPFLTAVVANGEKPLLLLDRAAILSLIPSFAQATATEAAVS